MEAEWLVGGPEVAMPSELGMVLEAGFVLRIYLVETTTETTGFAVDTGVADAAANLSGHYQFW